MRTRMFHLCPLAALTISLPVSATARAASQEVPISCQAIVKLANGNRLVPQLAIAFGEASVGPASPPKEVDGLNLLAYVDADGNGKREYLYAPASGPPKYFDEARAPVLIPFDPDVDWDSDEMRFMTVDGALTFGRNVYVLFSSGDRLSYATTFLNDMQRIACYFGFREKTATVYAMTEYQALVRDARLAGVERWEYASQQPGTRKLDVLFDHGDPINGPRRRQSLLLGPGGLVRKDVFDWLVKHGADLNVGTEEYSGPLYYLLADRDYERAANLIRAGADPQPYVERMAELMNVDSDLLVSTLIATSEKLRAIPESILLASLGHEELFDKLVNAGLPVQPTWSEWQAGVRVHMRAEAAAEFAKHAGALEKAQRLYANVVPAPTNYAVVRYGSLERGWKLERCANTPMSDEELVLFSTALCSYFLAEDCGSSQLQERAQAWALQLSPTCESPAANTMELGACNTVVFFNMVAKPNSPKPMFVLPTGSNWAASAKKPFIFQEMYRAKRASDPPTK